VQVITLTVKQGMFKDEHLKIEVTGRTAAKSNLALASELDARSGVDTRRDSDRDGAARLNPSISGTFVTGVRDDGAEPMTLGAWS
jgi:hypothetical protein